MKWIKTISDVYFTIYNSHQGELSCFQSYTDMGVHGEKLERGMTGWGFKGAKHPIIKTEYFDGESHYFIRK